MSNAVKQNALTLIRDKQMLNAREGVLAAVSGGADSLALLHLLCGLKEELALGEIAAAHIHHGLRGAEADRDEAAVRAFCEQQGVRLFVCHADVAAEARQRGCGVEEAGRAVRYAFLRQTAAENGFDRIATAHTLSDSMETVLLYLARGTGIGGLTGIPPVRENLIRPLLTCTRAEIEEYAAEHALPFVTDSTNSDLTFARNRVRGCIVPELYKLNPRVDEAFARLMRAAQADEEYWREQTVAALNQARVQTGVYRADMLQNQPAALRSRLLRQAAEESAGVCLEERHLRALTALLATGGTVTVNGGVNVSVKQGCFTVESPPNDTGSAAEQPLEIGKTYTFGTRRYRCELWDRETYENWKKIHKILLQSTCDYDRIGSMACVRTRRTGDVYHPFRRGGGKTLKKWMNQCRVPAALRNTWPLVADEAGVVLIPGLGCDHRAAIDGNTQRILAFFNEIEEG